MDETQPAAGDLETVDNPERKRWEVRSDGRVIAYAEYRLNPERITFTHTVVEPEQEGRGVGALLARTVLDNAVARGLRISPRCPFIRAYIERHPEYLPSVDMPQTR